MGTFKLRCELKGHTEDVRGVRASAELGILTSSRDKTAKIWKEQGRDFVEDSTLVGHTDFVVPISSTPSGTILEVPNGGVLTGSRDKTVILWEPHTATIVHKLEGHTYQVTGVGCLPSGEVVSTSLDKTVKIWRNGSCVRTLEGHEGPVLALAVLPNGDFLTGSGDCTVRLWSQWQCVQVFKGHSDTVRALAVLPGVGFVSASHDSTLRVWMLSGECIAQLAGHTALVYAVAATADGLLASGSEDNTVRLWRASGECVQVVEHPGCVWGLDFLPNGDLVTACSDAVARVWTSESARQADPEDIAVLDNRIAELKAAAAQSAAGAGEAAPAHAAAALPPGLKAEPPTALLQPGDKDGATKIIQEADGGVMAYGWDAAGGRWEKIGEVVAAPTGGAGSMTGARKSHLGREWDFVFDVDVEDGSPALKLAGDLHENPYDVADRFLEEQQLPVTYRQTIVEFVIKNTGGSRASASTSNMPITGGFCDPFTGGASSSAAQQQAARPTYTPPSAASMSVTGGGVDPFTGGGSSSSWAQGAMNDSSRQVALSSPAPRGYMIFDNVPPAAALKKKLQEFNSALAPDVSRGLTEHELASGGPLDALLALLPQAASGSSGIFAPEQLAVLSKMMRWPTERLFPVLDVLRVVMLEPTAANGCASTAGSVASPSVGTLGGVLAQAASEPVVAANQQTGLRLACSCFKHEGPRAWVADNMSALLDGYAGCSSTTNKNVRLSWATLLLDFSVLLNSISGNSSDSKLQLMSALAELLGGMPADDSESATRAFAGVAALIDGDKEMIRLAQDLGMPGLCRHLTQGGSGVPTKLKETAAQVSRLLGSS